MLLEEGSGRAYLNANCIVKGIAKGKELGLDTQETDVDQHSAKKLDWSNTSKKEAPVPHWKIYYLLQTTSRIIQATLYAPSFTVLCRHNLSSPCGERL